MNKSLYLLLLPLLTTPSICMSAEAHVHGVATLQITLEGNQLKLSFSNGILGLSAKG